MLLMIKEHLIITADRYCEEKGIKKSSLAKSVLKDSSFFARLENGSSCGLSTYEKFMNHFGLKIKIDGKTSKLTVS